jgi:hypothetical protein
MEKVTFKLAGLNNSALLSKRKTKPLVSVRKTGTIAFNKAAIEFLKAETLLRFDYNEVCPQDWYLITGEEGGLKLRVCKEGQEAVIQSTWLSKKIVEAADATKFIVSSVPVSEELPNVFFLIPQR